MKELSINSSIIHLIEHLRLTITITITTYIYFVTAAIIIL